MLICSPIFPYEELLRKTLVFLVYVIKILKQLFSQLLVLRQALIGK